MKARTGSLERRFHEDWLNMVRPAEGLVVSATVLEKAQCMERLPKSVQHTLTELCPLARCDYDPKPVKGEKDAIEQWPTLASLPALLEQLLELTPDLFDSGDALPEALQLYVQEGPQRLKPTMALKHQGLGAEGELPANENADPREAVRAGARYAMLVWEVGQNGQPIVGLPLDKPETLTGEWLESPQVKFDRLLRECNVDVGLLSNGRELRRAPWGMARSARVSGHFP